jgi:hypothetical protein
VTSSTASPLLSTMISYSTLSSNLKKFGPPYRASKGMKFAINVTLSGEFGLTNA